jgi:hypothetical protein
LEVTGMVPVLVAILEANDRAKIPLHVDVSGCAFPRHRDKSEAEPVRSTTMN